MVGLWYAWLDLAPPSKTHQLLENQHIFSPLHPAYLHSSPTVAFLCACCRFIHSTTYSVFQCFLMYICEPLCLSGGVESDGPPKKLFVAGVTDPANRSSYTVRWGSPWTNSSHISIKLWMKNHEWSLFFLLLHPVPPPPLSVSQSAADSPPAGGISPQSSPLSLSPPPSFTPFTSHQHPGH